MERLQTPFSPAEAEVLHTNHGSSRGSPSSRFDAQHVATRYIGLKAELDFGLCLSSFVQFVCVC